MHKSSHRVIPGGGFFRFEAPTLKFGPFQISFEKKSLSAPDGDLLETFGILPGTINPLSVPAVAACVRLISEACAVLDINVVENKDDGAKVEHPALPLLRGQANGWTAGNELIRDLVSQALTSDAGGLAWVNRVEGRALEIIRYDTGRITVEYDTSGTGEPTYRLNGNVIDASDVIHIRGPFSKCPVSLASNAISAAAVMEQHASRLFRNGARPSGVVEVPPNVGEDAVKKIRAGFSSAYEGSDKAGKTLFLYNGSKFSQMQLSSVDAQFLEMRRYQTEEIARAFNLSASMIGDLTKSSYANASQKQLEFLVYAVEPWLCAVEAAFNRVLLNDDERKTLTFKFDRDDLTRASLVERATAINSLIASETINPNEGRNWLGLSPYAGGDKFSNRNINQKPAAQPRNEPTDE